MATSQTLVPKALEELVPKALMPKTLVLKEWVSKAPSHDRKVAMIQERNLQCRHHCAGTQRSVASELSNHPAAPASPVANSIATAYAASLLTGAIAHRGAKQEAC